MSLQAVGKRLVCFLVVLGWQAGWSIGRAQNIKAAVAGTIVDAQGAIVTGADVRIREIEKDLTRQVTSNSEGRFFQPALEPGAYQVDVAKPGFSTYRSTEFVLQVGDSVSLSIELQVGEVETTIEVVAKAPSALQTADTKQARSFSRSEMNDLPVQAGGTGRNFYTQALTTPGASLSLLAHRPFAVSGQRPRNNNYLIDSVETNDARTGMIAGRGVTEQLISQESVQSFELISHNFKAEYGRNSGAIVSLVSKSGSNDFHGSGFWFHNNSALRARNPFENEKTTQLSNLTGFTAGGPIVKNKAYFFGNYETFRPRGSQLATFRTITEEERARAAPSVRALVDLYPRSASGSRIVTKGVPRTVNQHTYMFRSDILLSPKQTMMLRTNYTDGVTDADAIGNTVKSRVEIHNQTRSVAAHHTYAFNPSALNELRLGYSRQTEDDAFIDSPLLGDPAVNGEIGFMIVPGLSLAGPLSFLGRQNFQNNYQLTDDLTIIRGRHNLKFGSASRRVEVNGGAVNNGFRGQIFFPNINAFLAAQPLTYNRNIGNPLISLRRWEWHSYLQDDWKITENLTLNLGVRYELNTAPSESHDRIPEEFRFRTDRNNVAPRFGVAWTPMDKTVVRAGYGIFYNALEMAFLGLTRFNPPLLTNLSAFRPSFPDLLARARTSTPSGLVIPAAGSLTPYAQHINLTVERELWNPGSTVSVAYVGTLGRKLSRTRRPNGGENLAQEDRPDPSVGVVNRLETSSSSTYHALQMALTQRFESGFLFRAAYTYSRFLDDVSEFANSNQRLDRWILPLDETNLALDRGLSDFHIPHAFNFTYLYELPWMPQDRWLGGWSFSGVTTLQSGRPYTLFSGTNNPTGTDNNRIHDVAESLIRDTSLNIPVRLAEGFTAAQLTPLEGALGTLGRNTERTDTLLSWNVSVSKNFSIDETKKLQVRGEFFNLFNTTNFDVVDNVLSSPNFGRALEAFDPRRVQLALRFVF